MLRILNETLMTGNDVLMARRSAALFITITFEESTHRDVERNHHVILLAMSNFGFHTLSKHPTGAQMLRDVGAVEFLTQLSSSVDPHLRTSVDSIFDQLFHLPEVLPSCPPTTTYQPRSDPSLQTGLDVISILHPFIPQISLDVHFIVCKVVT